VCLSAPADGIDPALGIVAFIGRLSQNEAIQPVFRRQTRGNLKEGGAMSRALLAGAAVCAAVMSLCGLAGCSETTQAVAVMAIDGRGLAPQSDLSGDVVAVERGDSLTVLSGDADDALEVQTSDGKQGWVRRCWICSSAEFERRKATNQTPLNLICIGHEDGDTFMYDGSLSIVDGQMSAQPGDAFWMDSTMIGQTFTFGDEAFEGDPSILLLIPESGPILRLETWPPK
jgi:hypothetical protein